MRHGWRIATHVNADGSVTARVTRSRRVMGRTRSRTQTYRLPPGSKVPRTAAQAERAYRKAQRVPLRTVFGRVAGR